MDTRGFCGLVILMILLMDTTFPCGFQSVTDNQYRYSSIQYYHVPAFYNDSGTAINTAISDEQRLLDYIMRGYERSVRPVRNASSAVVIQMGLTLTQVFDMDEKNQVLITNVWLDHEWKDEFLVWEPTEFNNITKLRIPCHKIWLPDMVLYNNAAEYTDGLMPANAMVENDGKVFWPVPTKLQSSCKVDVTYFPFDIQECSLKFGSWTYDGFQVDITNRTSEVDLSNYVINGEWELLDVRCVRNVVHYGCCVEPFPDVTFYIKIRRRTLFYMYNVVFPCVMMSALTLLVFCLPPDSGEKIALGITVLLAFSVFMLAVAENLPETSEFVPLISIYLTIVMALTSMSVIMTVFVLNLHHRGPHRHAVPQWLRSLFLGCRPGTSLPRSVIPGAATGLKSQQHNFNDVRYSGIAGHDNESRFRNMTLRMTLEGLIQELREDYQLENGMFEREINFPPHSHPYSNTCSVSMPSPASNATTDIRLDSNRSTPSPKIHKKRHSGSSSSTRMNHTMAASLTGTSAPCTPINHHLFRNQSSPSWTGSQSARTSSSPSSRQRPKSRSPYEEALLSVTKLLERHDVEEREYDDMQDWRRLAQTVDRILFVFFLIATILSTLTILVIIPSTQEE